MTHSQTSAGRSARTTENTTEISLEVNEISRRLAVDPRTSLLDLLRERLGLTGTKKGAITASETPGMYALESAMDELACAAGLDPVELRIRNEPAAEPDSGLPFSSRNLVACLREGARRFGWAGRDPRPGLRSDGRWLTGTGVAASTYPARRQPSRAAALARDGGFVVRIAAADIGTGARTALTQIAAETLATSPDRVRVELGDSDLPQASLMEQTVVDQAEGGFVRRDLAQYHIATGADAQGIDAAWVEETDLPEPDEGQGHRRDRHHRHRGRDRQRRLPRDRPPHP